MNSDYEIWVTSLRAWGRDPTTDLRHLPNLQADSFHPETFQRLLSHLRTAVEAMMATFSQRLQRDIAGAQTEHEMARAIVGLRVHLARRLQLADHPALPPEIRQPLWESAKQDIAMLQADLERAIGSPSSRYGSNRSGGERLLKLVRDNSFTALTAPGFPLGQLLRGGIDSMSPAPAPSAGAVPAAVPQTRSGPIRRRVFIDSSSNPS